MKYILCRAGGNLHGLVVQAGEEEEEEGGNT